MMCIQDQATTPPKSNKEPTLEVVLLRRGAKSYAVTLDNQQGADDGVHSLDGSQHSSDSSNSSSGDDGSDRMKADSTSSSSSSPTLPGETLSTPWAPLAPIAVADQNATPTQSPSAPNTKTKTKTKNRVQSYIVPKRFRALARLHAKAVAKTNSNSSAGGQSSTQAKPDGGQENEQRLEGSSSASGAPQFKTQNQDDDIATTTIPVSALWYRPVMPVRAIVNVECVLAESENDKSHSVSFSSSATSNPFDGLPSYGKSDPCQSSLLVETSEDVNTQEPASLEKCIAIQSLCSYSVSRASPSRDIGAVDDTQSKNGSILFNGGPSNCPSQKDANPEPIQGNTTTEMERDDLSVPSPEQTSPQKDTSKRQRWQMKKPTPIQLQIAMQRAQLAALGSTNTSITIKSVDESEASANAPEFAVSLVAVSAMTDGQSDGEYKEDINIDRPTAEMDCMTGSTPQSTGRDTEGLDILHTGTLGLHLESRGAQHGKKEAWGDVVSIHELNEHVGVGVSEASTDHISNLTCANYSSSIIASQNSKALRGTISHDMDAVLRHKGVGKGVDANCKIQPSESLRLFLDDYSVSGYWSLLNGIQANQILRKVVLFRRRKDDHVRVRTPQDLDSLFYLLTQLTSTLTELHLWNFEPEDLPVLARGLVGHSSLEYVQLHMETGTVNIALAETLATLPNLVSLELEVSASFPMALLLQSKRLSVLSIICSDNPFEFNSQEIIELAGALSDNTALSVLNIEPAIDASVALPAVLEALAFSNRSLETFQFSSTATTMSQGDAALQEILDALDANNTLRVLWNNWYESWTVSENMKQRTLRSLQKNTAIHQFHIFLEDAHCWYKKNSLLDYNISRS